MTQQSSRVTAEDLHVAYTDGIQIYVRNRHSDGVAKFGVDRIVIMLHGATQPGTTFDLPFAGKSWMSETEVPKTEQMPRLCGEGCQ